MPVQQEAVSEAKCVVSIDDHEDRFSDIEKRLAAIEQWKSEFRTLAEMGVDITLRT